LDSEPAGALTKGDGKGAGPGEANEAVLAIVDLSAGYAGHAVVIGVSLSLQAGEVVCIIGPNGAGKSTLLKGVTRDAQRHSGRVWLNGQDISDVAANRLASRGLGWVPQLDDVFPTLTVRENLEMGGYLLSRAQVKARVDEVTGVFPLLAPLMRSVAGRLSGGERKVLALGRALMTNPAVLLLDEPSAGLSPLMADQVLKVHVTALARSGVAVLLVEQRAIEAAAIASRVEVMVAGEIVASRPGGTIADVDAVAELFLGAGGSA
jgi:ABC-type branched-subunit amino acid transport system ATPase component